jgi:hypothetical protein
MVESNNTTATADGNADDTTAADADGTQINTQIKNYYSTTTTPTLTSCTTPQEKTIPLGPGIIANKGMRILAVFDPCRLIDGGAILNLPNSNNNLKDLVVMQKYIKQ